MPTYETQSPSTSTARVETMVTRAYLRQCYLIVFYGTVPWFEIHGWFADSLSDFASDSCGEAGGWLF